MATSGDNPIEQPADDLLGRTSAAIVIAEEIRSVDASKGSVVAVMGPWGSGKTSLVNLVRHELAKDPPIPVLDFNPWMFSGSEQLVDSFFRELAAQLGLKGGRLGQIASEVKAYGDLLSPVADMVTILSALPFAGILGRVRNAAGVVKNFQERRKLSVTDQRNKLAEKLHYLDRPIVVVADDIDRLTTNEIRDMFKLVRLTASFPNVIYLVAFDRKRVENALTEKGIEGRSYLEKIVQIAFDIPVLSRGVLFNQLGRALSDTLEEFSDVRFDGALWADVGPEVVLPLIRSMRDIRRYCASARGTVRSLGAEIELVDMLALEAIRVFMPDAFSCLADAQGALTDTTGRAGSDEYKAQIERLLGASGDNRHVITTLVQRIFPAGWRYLDGASYGADWLPKWIRTRRVAHPDILGLYLERMAGEKLRAFTDAERAFVILDDKAALDTFLRSIDLDRLEDVIAALQNYEGVYPVSAVPVATVVLLNLLPILPERPRGFFSLDARMVVSRVVLRLLRQIPSQDEVERVIREALPKLSTLSSRFHLVVLIGHRENAGHKLVSAPVAEELEAELINAVRAAEPSVLTEEWDLPRLLYRVQQKLPAGTSALPTFDNLNLNGKVLVNAVSQIHGGFEGSRVITASYQLQWDILVELYGNEETLERVVNSLEESQPTDQTMIEAVNLAKRYLGGWRPDPFEDS